MMVAMRLYLSIKDMENNPAVLDVKVDAKDEEELTSYFERNIKRRWTDLA